ncbi:unnamed protein product [Rangifer tarandus platyrhynchus]|uniref:Uncharacterized protein n=1 Tax=Rangifer tarandus platyrhynchus TaxID=3082113 RepID=A0AC59ZYW8_RANTA
MVRQLAAVGCAAQHPGRGPCSGWCSDRLGGTLKVWSTSRPEGQPSQLCAVLEGAEERGPWEKDAEGPRGDAESERSECRSGSPGGRERLRVVIPVEGVCSEGPGWT